MKNSKNEHQIENMQNLDLFGNVIEKDEILREKYIEPPFSVLDSRSFHWQKRKKLWKSRGIQSELGRDYNKSNRGLLDFLEKLISTRNVYTGTSIFDPVTCELIYTWFCPMGGKILDPFAGGSVRGIVASYIGYEYVGIELREEQVLSNIAQGKTILNNTAQPKWLIGDSNEILDEIQDQDFDIIFSCPPYLDLEVYSNDPRDLSNMDNDSFISAYDSIIEKSCQKLKNGGFAIFVVGDVRDKKTGFYRDFISTTKKAFYKAGLNLYNEAIYLENGLNTAAARVSTLMKNLKLVKVHQNILIFKK